MAPLTQAEQRTEALARQQSGVNPADNAAALDVIDDGGVDNDAIGQRAAPVIGDPPAPRELPPTRGAFDDKRAAIVGRFREHRAEVEAENGEDISDFTHAGLPPEFADQQQQPGVIIPAADDGDAAAPAADAPAAIAPQTVKVKVNGVVQEMSLDDVVEQAQRALASDDILGDAKRIRDEIKGIAVDVTNTVRRPDQQGHHAQHQPQGHHAQADNTRTQQDELDQSDVVDPPTTADPYDELMQKIQFGEPEEAKVLLRSAITQAADAAATRAVTTNLAGQRLQDEGARSAKVLKDFADSHPEIAKDKMARAAIEADVLDQQIEDIRALGLDPTKLRNDGLPTTSDDVAMAHRYYRSNGYQVKTPQKMLEDATDNFLKWKGGTPNTPAVPATPAADSRVEVTVDRTARRAAIPQQPNRTSAPRPAPVAQPRPAPVPRDRSAIVAAEIARRNLPRGRITG